MERGYLIDASKLKPHHEPKLSSPPPQNPTPLPPIIGELIVPEKASVLDLAKLLSQKPFVIIVDVMQLGIFATVEQTLDFETISNLARKYGFIAKKAA